MLTVRAVCGGWREREWASEHVPVLCRCKFRPCVCTRAWDLYTFMTISGAICCSGVSILVVRSAKRGRMWRGCLGGVEWDEERGKSQKRKLKRGGGGREIKGRRKGKKEKECGWKMNVEEMERELEVEEGGGAVEWRARGSWMLHSRLQLLTHQSEIFFSPHVLLLPRHLLWIVYFFYLFIVPFYRWFVSVSACWLGRRVRSDNWEEVTWS